MASEAKRRSSRRKSREKEEDNEGNEVCSCLCQKDISSIRAEVSAIRKMLANYCASENPNVNPQHEGNEVQKQDSSHIGDDVETDGSPEISVASSALLNDLVLRHLGSYLPVRDLLDCRLVCQAWNAAFSATLRTRSTYLKEKVKDIRSLISSVKKNPKLFPFPGCQLSDSMFNGKPEKSMKKFLRSHSHVFKRLWFPYSYESFGFACRLAKFVKTYFSHAEAIDMTSLHCSLEKSWTTTELEHLSSELEQLFLPELKILKLPYGIKPIAEIQVFVAGLIKAAPNLQRIEDFEPAATNAVISSGKMNLISSMYFNQTSVLPVPCIQLALNPPCKVSHFEIGDVMQWISNAGLQLVVRNAIVAVLVASRETLRSLIMTDLGSELKDFPVLPKLLNLHIRGYEEKCPDTYRWFPADVSKNFPALRTVAIQVREADRGRGVQDESLRKFLWDEPLLSVTSLKIHFAVHKDGMEFLGSIVPNVTNLWINWEMCCRTPAPSYGGDDLRDIWTVPFKIRRLEIVAFNPWTNSDFSLDSFLTGIPERLCHNLRQEQYAHLPMDPSYYDALRGYPSMLNLKDSLSELVITIDYPGIRDSQNIMERSLELGHPTGSSVSTFYGIRLMKTTMFLYLAYDHRKFYSSNFREFLAPIEGDNNVVLCHTEFPDPPGHSGIAMAF